MIDIKHFTIGAQFVVMPTKGDRFKCGLQMHSTMVEKAFLDQLD